MANVRNFNARNYNPSNEAHEDGRCDPDVEARLYAEIYYSNETYPDYNVNSSNINSIPGPSNQIPSLLSLDPSNSNQHEGRRNMRDQFHWPVDTRPGQNYNSTNQLITRDTTVVSNIEPTVEPYSKATGMFRKPYRALTDGGFNPPHGYPQPLISPHELLPRFPRRNNDRFKHDEKSSRTPRQQINPANRSYLRLENPKSDRWRTQHAEKFQKQKELNRIERKEKQSKKLNSLNRNARSKRQRTERNLRSDFVEGHVSDEEVGRISFTPLNELIELSPEESNQNSPESSPTVATEPTIIHEVPENSTNTEVSAERTIMETETPEKSQETRVEITETTSTQNVEDILNSRNSKYNTIEKSTKRNEPIAEDDLSESDESIFEVPVPPKPTPPLIDLPDSDDDNEDSSSDEEDSPVVMTGKSPNQTANQNTIDFTSEDSSRNNSPDSVSADELNAQVEEINSPESEIPVNIVLNCTQLQKGVSSLEEIRQMREPSSANNLHDDEDSMTESEAMNWVSVDVEMVNQKEAQRRDKPGTDDEHWQNFETPVTSLERLRNSTQSSNVVIAEEVPSTSQEENTVHIPENQLTPVEIPRSVADEIGVEMTTENISNQVSLTLPTDQMGPPTIPLEKRKRPHVSENDPEPDVSDKRPEKRHKQIENTRANMSFEEYIFEPMPKQLVTFYNRPQKEFIYEISEIQSRMPRDPARWAILDVDMMGSKRRGNRKTCAFCHKEGHRREQCMDRPKTIVCKMCGKYGHNEPRCPSTMCLTCGRKFSSYRKTCEYCNRLKCSTCGGTGHDKSGCPDLWRKYHLTTTGGSVNIPANRSTVMKPKSQLVCCICRRRGHDASSCRKRARHELEHSITPAFVTDYSCVIEERYGVEVVELLDSDDENSQKDIIELTIESDSEDFDDDSSFTSEEDFSCENIYDDEIVEVPVEKKVFPLYSISDSDDDDAHENSQVKQTSISHQEDLNHEKNDEKTDENVSLDILGEFSDSNHSSLALQIDLGFDDTLQSNLETNWLTRRTEINFQLDDVIGNESSDSVGKKSERNHSSDENIEVVDSGNDFREKSEHPISSINDVQVEENIPGSAVFECVQIDSVESVELYVHDFECNNSVGKCDDKDLGSPSKDNQSDCNDKNMTEEIDVVNYDNDIIENSQNNIDTESENENCDNEEIDVINIENSSEKISDENSRISRGKQLTLENETVQLDDENSNNIEIDVNLEIDVENVEQTDENLKQNSVDFLNSVATTSQQSIEIPEIEVQNIEENINENLESSAALQLFNTDKEIAESADAPQSLTAGNIIQNSEVI